MSPANNLDLRHMQNEFQWPKNVESSCESNALDASNLNSTERLHNENQLFSKQFQYLELE
jgi:hypothetical protein